MGDNSEIIDVEYGENPPMRGGTDAGSGDAGSGDLGTSINTNDLICVEENTTYLNLNMAKSMMDSNDSTEMSITFRGVETSTGGTIGTDNEDDPTLSITTSSGGSAKVSIGESNSIEINENTTNNINLTSGTAVTISANQFGGYNFNGFTYSGISLPSIENNEMSFVTGDFNASVLVNFSISTIQTYTITISEAIGGTASIENDLTNYTTGSSVTIVSTANSGYNSVGFEIDGTNDYTINSENSVTVVVQTSNITVTPQFKATTPINPPTYTISLYEIDNATISNWSGGRYVSTSHSITDIQEGANVSFDITAKPEYKLVSYIIDGNEYQFDNESQSTITVNNVTENKTIDFKISNEAGTVIVLGDPVQKHYRFKIRYKNKNSNEIIINWDPLIYTYVTETS